MCVVLIVATGCSALRVSYNQASWLAYRWFDGYVGFDAAQEKSVRDALAGWFLWHRRTELPDYADLLLKIESDIQSNMTAERTCGWWSAIRTRIDRAADRAVPAMAVLAASLKPAQIEKIERRYEKTNAEFRDDFMQVDREVRVREAAERVVSRAGWLYGDLDAFQRERVERWVVDSPYDPELAFDERKRRQQDALHMLRRLTTPGIDRAAAEADVRSYIRRISVSPREAYRQHSANVLQYSCRLAADIHNSTSAAQRRIASGKLKGWAADLRVLAAQPVD